MSGLDLAGSLIGGSLIGVSASMLLYFNGRIAGISGIVSGALFSRDGERAPRLWFLGGLLVGAALMLALHPAAFEVMAHPSVGLLIAAGLAVGVGTRLGNGCTSGHGVCGVARLSKRSVVATITFMLTAGVVVFISRHVATVLP